MEDSEIIAEIVQLPKRTTGHELSFRLELGPWLCLCILALGACIMADRLANAWNKIKANRHAVLTQIADELKTVKATHADDVIALRKQIDEDGMSDADRAALAEMEAEAAGGAA